MSEPRRWLHRSVACLMLAGLAGCASSPSKGPVPSRGLSRMVATGQMLVGTSGQQPPFSMTSRAGELVGLDVALARVLAQSMGLEARFVALPFDRLLDALENGEVDLVMSGMTITPGRSQRVTFVGPYYTSGKTILTRTPALAAASSPGELDSPQLRFAALRGSTSEAFVRGSLSRARLVAVERLEEAVGMVAEGRVDALVADRETCAVAVLRRPGEGLLQSEAVFTVEPMGIAVPPDDPRLAGLVQTYLDALASRGVLEKASAFWMKDPSWVQEIR